MGQGPAALGKNTAGTSSQLGCTRLCCKRTLQPNIHRQDEIESAG